ncbi:MAG: TonB-dependent receptor [Filimonas sp.]|nr:TonB-dependent receptor [Filimonas sp.]
MKKTITFLSFLLISFLALSQNRTIKGKITDDTGASLSAVSIIIKGTSVGTQSDEQGNFVINSNRTGKIELVFSYTGFKTVTVTAEGNNPVNVKLEKQQNELNDVVVVGYQTVKRGDLTTAVSSVNAKQLKDIPVATAAEAITGRLAGVNVTTTEGQPGANIIIRVRGGGSLTQDNSPLYIVDGVQVENALSILAPAEIATIDVLKDASSTAIYGARGANGVVVITTKSGSKNMEKPLVSLDAYWGVRKIAKKLKVLNPYEFVDFQRDLYKAKNDTAGFIKTYGQYADMDIYKNMPNVDWQEEVFGRAALEQNYTVSMSGGNKSTTYAANLSYNNSDGIQIGSGFKRYLASLRLDQVISAKVKAGLSARYSNQTVDGQGTSNVTSSNTANRLRNIVRYKPYRTAGDATGSGGDDETYNSASNLANPVAVTNDAVRHAYQNTLILTGYLTYNILKELTFKSSVGLVNTNARTNSFYGLNTYESIYKANKQPIATIETGTPTSVTATNTLAYTKTFASKHSVSALIGQEIYQLTAKTFNTNNSQLPKDITADQAFARIQTVDPALTPAYTITTAESTEKLSSFFGKVNYAYDGKYLFAASLRADGSSKFASNNRWGYFPAASVAWRISKEAFMADVKAISDLKLRFSYGSSGNNRISNDAYLFNFSATASNGYAYGDALSLGMVSSSLANTNLRWETTITRNVGVDFGLFNNIITGSIDAYWNNTNDLLLQATVPATSGYTTQYQNVGKTENKGLELQLSALPVSNKNFQWTTTFNISANRNKIVSLGTDATGHATKSIPSTTGWANNLTDDVLTAVGHPVGEFYGYIADGYYRPEDFTGYDAANKKFILKAGVADNTAIMGAAPAPGSMKMKKIANDGTVIVGEGDKTVLGNPQPKFFGGWNNQFAYKSFDLSIFMNFSVGGKVYNANKIEYMSGYYSDNNMLADVKDRFRPYDANGQLVTDLNQLAAMNTNAKTFFPSRSGNYLLSSYAIEDGSFLRINNVTLGYTLPASILKRTKTISKLRVYATVNNLWVITGYSGYDPEVNTRRSTPLTPGVDYSAFPRSRFFVGGVNITF